jgi:hypothetical protein
VTRRALILRYVGFAVVAVLGEPRNAAACPVAATEDVDGMQFAVALARERWSGWS